MIGALFNFCGEIVEVRIDNSNCLFRTSSFGGGFAPLDGLRLDKQGTFKEFPDLVDRDDWRDEAIKRFKEKIKNMKNEEEQMNYIIEDLKKYGYQPLYLNKQGHRPVKLQ